MSTTKRVSFIRRYADVGVLEIPMGVNVIINDGPCAHLDKAYPLAALPEHVLLPGRSATNQRREPGRLHHPPGNGERLKSHTRTCTA